MKARSMFASIGEVTTLALVLAIVASARFCLAPGQMQRQKQPVAEKIPVWLYGKVELKLSTDKQNKLRNYPVLLYVKGSQPHWVKDKWFFWGYLWYQEADVIMEVDGQMSCSRCQEGEDGKDELLVGGEFVEELVYAGYDPQKREKIPQSLMPYPAESRMVYGGDFRYAFGWNFGPRPLTHKEERSAYLKVKPVVCNEN